jgi:protoporphyrinogen oxidase
LTTQPQPKSAIVIGAGPAGLSAAYELTRANTPVTVLEGRSTVGGLARTVAFRGSLFDIGGHRFFTQIPDVERIWRDLLGADLLSRRRMSRIYYRSSFFHYPLEARDVIRGLGFWESARCALSYARSRLWPVLPEEDFEAWVTNRFGRRLFENFFRTYTEKVWGMPCREIGAQWAAQRIQGLSLPAAVGNAILPGRSAARTLIREFHYPRRGPGMLWLRMRSEIERMGGEVRLGAPVTQIAWETGGVMAVEAGGQTWRADHFISTMPLRDLARCLAPAPSQEVARAAAQFLYRGFLTVILTVRGCDLFPDNWIYVHDPALRVARVQNFSNWSPEMSPLAGTTCLGVEYFCSEGDDLWTQDDGELIRLAARELAQLGFGVAGGILDGTVIREPEAYPVYAGNYVAALHELRRFLSVVPNLQLAGRNGTHSYNNMDHAMMSGLLAAGNILGRRDATAGTSLPPEALPISAAGWSRW